MRFSEILRIVYVNIMRTKAKVLLTSLGIIVGAATIVMVIAIGRGGEEEVMAQFSGLSAETIYVNPNYLEGNNTEGSEMIKLNLEHINQIMQESTTISSIYIRVNTFEESIINGQKSNMSVVGVTEEYSKVSNLDLAYGNNIDEIDLDDESNVAVIGDELSNKYFSNPESAIGAEIRIKNKTFRIIGVLKRTGDGIQGISPDDSIFIPFTTASNFLGNENSFPQIVALAKDLSLVKKAMFEIEDTLGFMLESDNLYKVSDAGTRIEAATKSARTMKLLLMAVATIVFIVGGIGIMNVLFVSVKERTKEIGILKALGSCKKDIMIQFLLESIIISVFGGTIGILVSVFIMPLMKYTDIAVSPSVGGKFIALLFAIVTGTVFGLYPAYKAAQLKPIEALNYE